MAYGASHCSFLGFLVQYSVHVVCRSMSRRPTACVSSSGSRRRQCTRSRRSCLHASKSSSNQLRLVCCTSSFRWASGMLTFGTQVPINQSLELPLGVRSLAAALALWSWIAPPCCHICDAWPRTSCNVYELIARCTCC